MMPKARCPGLGTLTDTVRTAENSATGTVTVSVVGVIGVGVRTLGPKFTTVPLTKPVPIMVRDL